MTPVPNRMHRAHKRNPLVWGVPLCLLLIVSPLLATRGWSAAPEDVERLIATALDAKHSQRARARALQALGALMDPRAEQALLDAVARPERFLKGMAARALGRPGRSAAVSSLARLLASPVEDSWVRSEAARALGVIGHPDGVAPLQAASRDGDPKVRGVALYALTAEGFSSLVNRIEIWLRILQDAELEGPLRVRAAGALAAAKEARAVPPLTTLLLGPPPVPPTLPPGAPHTLQVLTRAVTRETDLRLHAARALATIGSPEAVPALASALRDPSPDLRAEAAAALGHLQAASALPDLFHALKDPDPSVRWQTVRALGEIGAPSAVPLLIQALKDAQPSVRLQAVMALTKFKDLSALSALKALAEAESAPLVRQAARDAIKAIESTSQEKKGTDRALSEGRQEGSP